MNRAVDRRALLANCASAREDAEALALDAERDVELAAEVLEGGGRGQLDHLRFREVAAGLREQLLGDLLGRGRHGFRENRRPAPPPRGGAAPPRTRHPPGPCLLRRRTP